MVLLDFIVIPAIHAMLIMLLDTDLSNNEFNMFH